MGYKKHNWMSYQRTGDMIEITVRDSSGSKMDFFRTDKKEEFSKRIAPILASKYGWKWKPEVSEKESVNEIKEKENKEKEDWLAKDMGW